MNIKSVFVIGAGAMGAGITQVAASKGYQIYLSDLTIELVNKSIAKIDKQLSKSAAKGKITEEERLDTIGRITACTGLADAAKCELIIEAAAERMDVKKSIFTELNDICKEDTIFASNTSSLSITAIAATLKHPENFVGMHFFNPVPVMKLLELIAGIQTSAETLAAVHEFGTSLGKVTIEAKDGPGFIVNRILTMELIEAVELLDQGYGSVEDIDAGMVCGCGHPMGPLTLLDLVGLDITLAVSETLYTELGDSKYRPAMLLRKMVRAGLLGQKTGKGFYIYDGNGGKVPNPMLATLKGK